MLICATGLVLEGRAEPSKAQAEIIAITLAAASSFLGFDQSVHGRFERNARRLIAVVIERELDGIGYRTSQRRGAPIIEGATILHCRALMTLRGCPPFGFGLFLEESALSAVLGSCVNLPALPFLYPPNKGPRIRLVRS